MSRDEINIFNLYLSFDIFYYLLIIDRKRFEKYNEKKKIIK